MAKDLTKRFLKSFMQFRRVHVNFESTSPMHPTELFAMMKILQGESDGRGPTGSELKAELNINKSAVSQMLSGLEQKGFVERKVNPDDRRKTDLCPTAAGKEAVEQMWAHTDYILSSLIERFGEEQTIQLIELLDKLKIVFNEIQRDMRKEREENQ